MGAAITMSRQALEVLSVWPRTIVADLCRHDRNVDRVLEEAGLDLQMVNREGAFPGRLRQGLMEIAARELPDASSPTGSFDSQRRLIGPFGLLRSRP
jgi:hypothetical protein